MPTLRSYFCIMAAHILEEHPWRVKVEGCLRGAGVLLDERHVLTCAHVIGDEDGRVSVQGAVNLTVWRRTGRVVPGTWVYRNDDTSRGDVALLVLDDPAPSDLGTRLWHAPLSGGEVRAYGYPEREPDGSWASATLGNSRGRGFELGQLNPVGAEVQWVEPGFSGAGVVMQKGSHTGHVIGIVVQEYHDQGVKHASLMPTGTILRYLPEDFAGYVTGQPPDRLGPSGGGLTELPGDDVLQIALTRELQRLLTSGWTGTVVILGGASTGRQWLVRLVRTSDPGTRARTPDDQFSAVPADTILPLGTIDAAYDARGKTVTEVIRYLAERFGLPLFPDRPDVIRELLRRRPPACIVIVGVDRAGSPSALIREVLRPLAVGARSRGLRLVLGFDGKPPATLPHQVLLDPEPLDPEPSARGASPEMSVAAAGEQVERLAAAEEEVAQLSIDNENRFHRSPPLPSARAPMLRVRLAVAEAAEPTPELAAIGRLAAVALGEAESFTRELRQADEELTDLRHRLEVNRERLDRYFRDLPGAGDEHDPRGIRFDQLSQLYKQAKDALWQAPVDLAAAGRLVRRYEDEADGFIGGTG